jgi:phosphonate transport system ATP-binding protein
MIQGMPTPAEATSFALEVRNLTKRYPGAASPSLADVSFRVERGAFAVVLGRSGSGKTTLFRCLNRLSEPDSGAIFINGVDLISLNRRRLMVQRKQIATIFQQYNLIRRRTVLYNVLAGRLADVPFWRVAAQAFPTSEQQWALHCLARVGLLDLADRRADRLSGGQQQRVAIARAIAQQPLIILADEPVASLDRESATLVLDELSALSKQENLTILCSLHQEDFAMRYATQIIGLRTGRVFVDTPCAAFGEAERDLIYSLDQSPVSNADTAKRITEQNKR